MTSIGDLNDFCRDVKSFRQNDRKAVLNLQFRVRDRVLMRATWCSTNRATTCCILTGVHNVILKVALEACLIGATQVMVVALISNLLGGYIFICAAFIQPAVLVHHYSPAVSTNYRRQQ